jgi:hypothetical protein
MNMRTVHTVTEDVRAEFLAMPGMRLTDAQLQRLCGVEQDICDLVLDALVAAKFLYREPDGTYARFTEGVAPHPHPAKASRGIACDDPTVS